MLAIIESRKLMDKIVDKFISIFRNKNKKEDVKVSKENETYTISYGRYTLIVGNNTKMFNFIYLLFKCGGKKVCHHDFIPDEERILRTQVCDVLLTYCNDKLQYDKNMEIVQEFLGNN